MFFHFGLQVVKELLVRESGISSHLLGSDVEWCREEELPEETRCKVWETNLILISSVVGMFWRVFWNECKLMMMMMNSYFEGYLYVPCI